MRDRRALIGGDRQALEMLLHSFLQAAPKRVAAMTSGLNDRDTEAVRRAAQKLTSSAGEVGAANLSGMYRRVEAAANAGDRQTPATRHPGVEAAFLQVSKPLLGKPLNAFLEG